MKTIIEKNEKRLRQQLHILTTKMGMSKDDYRLMLIDNFGVSSSVELNVHQLADLIYSLERKSNSDLKELDRWRKRTMASIGGYLKASGQQNTSDRVKAIACRAAGYDNFNKIPKQRLIDVYYAFKNKQKTFTKVEGMTNDDAPVQNMLLNTTTQAMA